VLVVVDSGVVVDVVVVVGELEVDVVVEAVDEDVDAGAFGTVSDGWRAPPSGSALSFSSVSAGSSLPWLFFA
jgi:hypothetical protein